MDGWVDWALANHHLINHIIVSKFMYPLELADSPGPAWQKAAKAAQVHQVMNDLLISFAKYDYLAKSREILLKPI